MYTQCPHCQTLFRISSEQLKSAGGKARCCQCKQVFNALAGLREDIAHADASAPVQEQRSKAESLFTDTLNLDSSQLFEPSDEAVLFEATDESVLEASHSEESSSSLFWEQDNGLETEPAYLAMGSESQMSELLDHDSSASSHPLEQPAADATVIPFQDRNPGLDSEIAVDQEPASDEVDSRPISTDSDAVPLEAEPPVSTPEAEAPAAEREKPSADFEVEDMFEQGPAPWATLAWGLGGLLLIGVFALQLAWYHREQVVQHPYGQRLLQTVCSIVPCKPPERRDISQIQIEHRDLRAHPERADALLLQLGMVNRAAYDQPYPRLQLSLFNDNQKLIAQRIFEPGEYLSTNLAAGLMLSRRTVNISMELLDPGKEVTGFKFEFL